MKRTSIHLGDRDRLAIATIKERYGASTDSDAIRLALRVLAESKKLDIIVCEVTSNVSLCKLTPD